MSIIKKKTLVSWLLVSLFILMVAFLADTQEISTDVGSETISLDFKNADIDNVLMLLAQQNNLNLVLLDQIKGKRGSFYYAKISLTEALEHMLANTGFKFVIAEETRTVQISAINSSRTDTRIFRLRNADPLNIKRLLEEEVSDIGRIQINRDTNSLIITDTFSNFNKIIELINALDIPTADETTLGQVEITDAGKEVLTNVFVCRYVEAVQLKEILSKLVTESGVVEADPLSNSLVVRDSPQIVQKIKDLVHKLDKETPQVMIDAELIEIAVGRITELGVRWFYVPGGGTIGTMNYKYQTEPMPEGTGNYGLASAQAGASFLFGEVGDEFRGVINALITENKADLLANPKITVINNQEAKIEITEKYPYQQIAGYDEHGNPEYTVDFLDIGIVLTVTPSIKEDVVTLKLQPEVSYQQGEAFGIPIKALRKASTQVNVRNGKTIVIGGLISNKKTKAAYKIPILGSLPLIGRLFRSDKDVTDKVELAIFVTPRILSQVKMEKIGKEEKEKFEKE